MRVNKWGKFRIVRFLIIGWTLQSIHVLDRTEKLFRIALEGTLFVFVSVFYSLCVSRQSLSWSGYIIIFVLIHSVILLFNSAGLVGLRECFGFIRNPGIKGTISFLLLTKKLISASDSAECVLVYGSIARYMFHDRSDLDLRIIRRANLWQSLRVMLIAICLRTIAVWRYHIPLDLKVVDSMDFLKKEMRADEKPIVVYYRPGFTVYNRGIALEEILNNPSIVLKSANLEG